MLEEASGKRPLLKCMQWVVWLQQVKVRVHHKALK